MFKNTSNKYNISEKPSTKEYVLVISFYRVYKQAKLIYYIKGENNSDL